MPQLKLLIVDDERSIRELLVDYFSQCQFECKSANSGEGALTLMPEFEPHIVITDFNMPQMNGIELLKRIREQNSKTKVIILTGFPDQQNAIDAVNFGARAFLLKPFNLGDISALLEEIKGEVAEEIGEKIRSKVDAKERSKVRVQASALEDFHRKYYSM